MLEVYALYGGCIEFEGALLPPLRKPMEHHMETKVCFRNI